MMELSWTLGPDQSAGDRHSLQGLVSRLKHNLTITITITTAVAITTVDIRLCAKIISSRFSTDNVTDLDKYNFLLFIATRDRGQSGHG